jgi:hypothetical protein
MHTAELREEPLSKFSPTEREGWMQDLHAGAAAARLVADELEKAAERLTQAREASTSTTERIVEKYLQLTPELRQFVSEEVTRMLAKQAAGEPDAA